MRKQIKINLVEVVVAAVVNKEVIMMLLIFLIIIITNVFLFQTDLIRSLMQGSQLQLQLKTIVWTGT